jgi:hypothetical protein
MSTNYSSHVRFFFAAALLLATAIWVVFAYSLAPVLIAKAYHGESLTIFNRLITGQARHPLTEYFAKWNRLASKVSFGLAVLDVYILLAVVGLTRKTTVDLTESASIVAIPRLRLFIIYALGAVIFGGALTDLVRDTEHWPFSQYPMFSEIAASKTYSTLRLYGVVQRSPLLEMQLDNNLYLQPFDNSRLPAALEHAFRRNRLEEAMLDCLTRYKALRRAGRHDGPPLIALRLYRVTWTLDPSASNIDRPDRKDLLIEVPAPPKTGD